MQKGTTPLPTREGQGGGSSSKLKSLMKDTVIYGMSSIVGRFLNYLLVPIYTAAMSVESGGYGVVTEVYAYTALALVILTCGMETTMFRFANKGEERPDDVLTVALSVVGTLSAVALLAVFCLLGPISTKLGHPDHPYWIGMMAVVTFMDVIQAVLFSWLRYQHRPWKFMSLKMVFIVVNVVLNCMYFLVLPRMYESWPDAVGYIFDPTVEVGYAFRINLVCTGLVMLLFMPMLFKHKWHFDTALMKRMLKYTWPLMVLGVAGMLNQVVDKILFKHVYPGTLKEGEQQLAIYGACVKVAMLMALCTQAYRYALEPMVFGQKKGKDKDETNVVGMKYFIVFTLMGFLAVMGYLDLLKILFIRNADYWPGLAAVPIVMAAEIMMGIYFNLSFWYKLNDKTIYGAWFSLAGCAVMLLVIYIGVPRISYMACAWAGLAGYTTCTLLSYFIGQSKHPVNYPLGEIACYVLLAAALYFVMTIIPIEWPLAVRLLINTVLIAVYCLYLFQRDLKPILARRRRK